MSKLSGLFTNIYQKMWKLSGLFTNIYQIKKIWNLRGLFTVFTCYCCSLSNSLKIARLRPPGLVQDYRVFVIPRSGTEIYKPTPKEYEACGQVPYLRTGVSYQKYYWRVLLEQGSDERIRWCEQLIVFNGNIYRLDGFSGQDGKPGQNAVTDRLLVQLSKIGGSNSLGKKIRGPNGLLETYDETTQRTDLDTEPFKKALDFRNNLYQPLDTIIQALRDDQSEIIKNCLPLQGTCYDNREEKFLLLKEYFTTMNEWIGLVLQVEDTLHQQILKKLLAGDPRKRLPVKLFNDGDESQIILEINKYRSYIKEQNEKQKYGLSS